MRLNISNFIFLKQVTVINTHLDKEKCLHGLILKIIATPKNSASTSQFLAQLFQPNYTILITLP